ncbi:MAG: tetratricopeptide repeat protein, partial [Gammaproteobacteria bacterium]|nr:tetratricopeptide repeat protein [Gammaproteobacteria bacterium]
MHENAPQAYPDPDEPQPDEIARPDPRWLWATLAGGALIMLLAGTSAYLQRDGAPTGDPLERARDYAARHEYRAAVIEYKNLLQDEPLNAQARRELGELYLTLGDAEAAAKELRVAGEYGYSAAGLLEAWLALGRYEEVLEHADELDSDDARINVAAGKALLGLARFDEAEALFTKIADRFPDYGGPRLGLAQLAYIRRDIEAALELAGTVGPEDRGYPDARKLIGEIALEGGQYAEAKKAFRTALEQRPNDI